MTNAQAGDRPHFSPINPGWVISSRLRVVVRCIPIAGKGPAADMAACGAIAVTPTSDWWRKNPSHQRVNSKIRYSLIVSLRAAASVNPYTAIQIQIDPAIPFET